MDYEKAFLESVKTAPRGVKIGRVILRIACILFFIVATVELAVFIVSVAIPDLWTEVESQFTDVFDRVQFFGLPVLAILYVLAAVGGLCYLADKSRFKKMASLAAIILLVVFLIDIILSVRSLVYDLIAPEADVGRAWREFIFSFIGNQITGGLYFIGWFMQKDYMGD